MRRITLALALALLVAPASAIDRHVPSVYPTIQAGINAALPGDTVVVAAGTYPESINFNGKAITVRGEKTVLVFIEPPTGPGVQFTSGEGAGSRLEELTVRGGDNALGGGIVIGVNASPRFDSVTVTQCDAVFGGAVAINSGASPYFLFCAFSESEATIDGGGVACLSGSSPTFEASVFRSNDAGGSGGNLFIADADVTVVNCNFRFGNADFGGAIAVEGGTLDYRDATITGVGEIQRNRARVSGGAMSFHDGATATMHLAGFDFNDAVEDGGGVFVTTGASVVMSTCRFNDNTAANGGGIAAVGGEATVSRTEFDLNTADSLGGAVYVFSDSDDEVSVVNVVQCRITGNLADRGGAISARSSFVLDGVPSTTLRLSNSIVEFNRTLNPAGSGGIEGVDAGSAGVQTVLDIRSCTIADNTGGAVNGVHALASPSAPQLHLFNTIVWDNEGANVASDDASRTSTGYSIFPETASYPGPGNLSTDPMFGVIPFGARELAPGSPARDAGSNAEAAPDIIDADDDGDTIEPLPFDYSGASSPFGRFINDGGVLDTGVGPGDVIDIGAQEAFEGTPCSDADLVTPGTLDFDDVLAFLSSFGSMSESSDLAPPLGVWDFADVLAFLTAFGEGCAD